MNNFYRSFNVNGNPHVWVYTDDAGELQFVPCSKESWIDPSDKKPDQYEVVLVSVGLRVRSDRIVNDVFESFEGSVDGWQPMPEAMEVAR